MRMEEDAAELSCSREEKWNLPRSVGLEGGRSDWSGMNGGGEEDGRMTGRT